MFQHFRIGMLIRAMWHPAVKERPEVIGQVVAIGLPAVPQLIKALGVAPGTCGAAQEALVKIGRPAVPALIEALRHRDFLIQTLAAEALGEIGDTRAIEPLLPLLRKRQYWIRKEAVAALGKLGDPSAGDALLPMLDDAHEEVRAAAAEALGRLQDTRAVEALRRALDDGCENVQAEAVTALAQLNATEVLLDALRHGSPQVRACAAYDLMPQTLSGPQQRRAMEALRVNLEDSDRGVRDAATVALGRFEELPSSTSPQIS